MEFHSIKKKLYLKLQDNESTGYFITFRFMVPYRVPVKNGSTAIIKEKHIFLFINKDYTHPATDDLIIAQPIKHTIIEVTTKLTRKEFRNYPRKQNKKETKKDKFTSDKFYDVFYLFNNLISHIALIGVNYSIYPIVQGDIIGIPLINIYQHVDNDKINSVEKSLLNGLFNKRLIHDNHNNIKKNEFDDAVYMTSEDNDPGNYYEISKKFRESERMFFNEKFDESIVLKNTGFEMFVTNLIIRYYALIKGKDEKYLYNISVNTPFQNLIDDHLFKEVFSYLDLENSGIIKDLIRNYLKGPAKYRHEIVHRGRKFSIKEAHEAAERMEEIGFLMTDNIGKLNSDPFVDEFNSKHTIKRKHRLREIKKKYHIIRK